MKNKINAYAYDKENEKYADFCYIKDERKLFSF